ncbi:MAG TPA: 2-C-methyl-D-erythritol 2,4-cyclodiphosphate synthase [Defluviitaleaceae bacterium]|jgi:2-C-methyl-D-erythritol 2,4-cyclodiphosphate synthase|nr:2-C-methyl-D-erythritol 2,4-cyclodiphosphate synthase [Candidatus Epulonipiscium sp.]HOA80137.1 2-C-methyl-D-erythritol 2,4-cyclodiphosphate synthase [Defluviitaleaceae bacterium]
MRVGIGYDVHKLTKNRKLILGGIEIPYEVGLAGHSDADVLVHAIMDALLGAAAKGDIGKLFPDNSEEYKDISSMILLKKVRDLLNEEGYSIENIDSTIVAQKPKLASYIDDMRKSIAKALNIDIQQINIKATTEEGLGFTGEGKGIAAYAICSLKNEPSFPLK